jgi:nucleotide-binding universal stress UspA family protein
MNYKTIVVQLDTSEHTPRRLDCAWHVAKRFGAHLSAVYTDYTSDQAQW